MKILLLLKEKEYARALARGLISRLHGTEIEIADICESHVSAEFKGSDLVITDIEELADNNVCIYLSDKLKYGSLTLLLHEIREFSINHLGRLSDITNRKCTVVNMFSGHGGSGTTAVSAAVALRLAEKYAKRVCLIDFSESMDALYYIEDYSDPASCERELAYRLSRDEKLDIHSFSYHGYPDIDILPGFEVLKSGMLEKFMDYVISTGGYDYITADFGKKSDLPENGIRVEVTDAERHIKTEKSVLRENEENEENGQFFRISNFDVESRAVYPEVRIMKSLESFSIEKGTLRISVDRGGMFFYGCSLFAEMLVKTIEDEQ